ncbi:hypothetical protein BDC45DRAFT_563220 [Circinella umbellata]|nr:hypothetical protein BDC45DRAFT_563220 [Circinella umbellata]
MEAGKDPSAHCVQWVNGVGLRGIARCCIRREMGCLSFWFPATFLLSLPLAPLAWFQYWENKVDTILPFTEEKYHPEISGIDYERRDAVNFPCFHQGLVYLARLPLDNSFFETVIP